MSTIFKKIIDREIPADIVYEDEHVLAFLDINPVRRGHTLVIPKKECVNIFDAEPETMSRMIVVAQKIAHALQEVVGAKGVTICMNNGDAADQDVPHAHIHVVPRFERGEAFATLVHDEYGDGPTLALKIKTAVA